MSFRIKLDPRDRAAALFMVRTHVSLVNAAIEQKKRFGFTQRKVADSMGVDKSSVSRILSGRGNPTLRTIGELAWALNLEPRVEFRAIDGEGNQEPWPHAVSEVQSHSSSNATPTKLTIDSDIGANSTLQNVTAASQ
ncbi:MAG: helix-turn-helix transcriptional regulator [Rhodobacteraceae bacterium]|nr:helix-turn-helix transcriptional regulator [Paracoccaceae bacterium]